jgi:hypothetical protein
MTDDEFREALDKKRELEAEAENGQAKRVMAELRESLARQGKTLAQYEAELAEAAAHSVLANLQTLKQKARRGQK